jgi:hypothetical protein
MEVVEICERDCSVFGNGGSPVQLKNMWVRRHWRYPRARGRCYPDDEMMIIRRLYEWCCLLGGQL